MDVPRIRYELLTRQVGHSAPVADAGPNSRRTAGTSHFQRQGSYSPDHDALSYSWAQISGPDVARNRRQHRQMLLSTAGSTSYAFRLTVTDQLTGLSATATTTGDDPERAGVVRFRDAEPDRGGTSSTLSWNVPNATAVSISASGFRPESVRNRYSVSSTDHHLYLTATGSGGQSMTSTSRLRLAIQTFGYPLRGLARSKSPRVSLHCCPGHHGGTHG